MKKYPVKSNWITYERNTISGDYIVHNHLYDIDVKLELQELKFINKLDGKVNPYKLLQRYLKMDYRQANEYLDLLNEYGLIRFSNKVDDSPLMRTVFRIYNSYKYCKLSKIILWIFILSFLPILCIGFYNLRDIIYHYGFSSSGGIDGPLWLGVVLGLLIGMILHELAHAISCCSFGGIVMEFGVCFRGFPAAYTMLDAKSVSRGGQIVIDLAGIMTNLAIAGISIIACNQIESFTSVFFMVGVINMELALINILFIEGIDGCNAMKGLLGLDGLQLSCNRVIAKYRREVCSSVRESEKTIHNMFRVLGINKLVYPILLVLNVCLIMGW